MKTTIKLLTFLPLALGAAGLSAPVVLAAPPANDVMTGAIVATIGFHEVLDTTEATTDADDDQLDQSCIAPALDASVWYVFEGTGTYVVVNVRESSYSAALLVGVGSPGNLETVDCGPDFATFYAEPRTTYYILAIDDQFDGGGNGGTLNISFSEIPPPTINFTVNRLGTFNRLTGVATISGTYTCTGSEFSNEQSVLIVLLVNQNIGQSKNAYGQGLFKDSHSDTCDGTPHDWSIDVVPGAEFGGFRGGKIYVRIATETCHEFGCDFREEQHTVTLRGKKN